MLKPAGFSQHASVVEVYEGEESVLLPFQVRALVSSASAAAVWNHSDSNPLTVHVRLRSDDDLRNQNRRYIDRTSVRAHALQTGDLSLILRSPTASDSSTYTCSVCSHGQDLSQTDVQLKVKGQRNVQSVEHRNKKNKPAVSVEMTQRDGGGQGLDEEYDDITTNVTTEQWLVNIRRDHFTITSHTRVCSRHFASDQLIEPTTLDGRRRLIKGAVPTLFEWNGYKVEPPRRSVWERTERRPELVPADDQEEHSLTRDHDYCSVPEPSALDISASAAEDLSKDVETLRKEIQELRVQQEFGLQRFAGSDTDIRFYTRFPSYDHLMAFWFLIEPCIYKMIRVSRAKSAANRNEEVLTPARTSTRQLLQPIDEFFLFLVFLSVGLKERDLAHRFNIHQSTS
ncbi:uncharacterized protein LOC102076109 [Oreochromis niloticus]|uniref:uncharacterized protein LOC102076109 n=1 Tax=Oreochromis niloticus TaxID=8128 RepID=UPI000DF453D7|nr:uncharacterized protein LOC102076109 [Oreochromis niloticus]